MPNQPQPPQYPPQKGIGGAWEETDLDKEAIEPISQDDRIKIFLKLIEEYKEMQTAGYNQDELDAKREEIFEKWNELNKILTKNDKARQMIEDEMEKLEL